MASLDSGQLCVECSLEEQGDGTKPGKGEKGGWVVGPDALSIGRQFCQVLWTFYRQIPLINIRFLFCVGSFSANFFRVTLIIHHYARIRFSILYSPSSLIPASKDCLPGNYLHSSCLRLCLRRNPSRANLGHLHSDSQSGSLST